MASLKNGMVLPVGVDRGFLGLRVYQIGFIPLNEEDIRDKG
jgi:hypothetical protein